MSSGKRAGQTAAQQEMGRLWFGTTVWQFLKSELADFPGRKTASLRLFIVTLTIVIADQTLHMPPLAAIAIAISMGYNPYFNAGQSLSLGLRQFGFLVVTVVLSISTLILAGDIPWLLLPIAFCVIALALCHAQIIAWPTGIAIWFAATVLYNPSAPEENVYTALWYIPVMGILAIGSWTVVQLTVKPQDPFKLFVSELTAQLYETEKILGRLADADGTPHNQPHYPEPGGFSKTHDFLTHALLLHPTLSHQYNNYLALLIEIDGLRHITGWLEQSLHSERKKHEDSEEYLEIHTTLQSTCCLLRQALETGQQATVQIPGSLPDPVLTDDSPKASPSLLTAICRSLQRIAELTQQLYGTEPEPKEPQNQRDQIPDEGGRVPFDFGYAFWSTNADSLKYGIKFALGTLMCSLFVESLSWPEINTAIITCLIAAQNSLGADYRQSILRLAGSILGGLCAYVYVILLQSHIDTLAGFLTVTTPVWALAAWTAAGSDRTSYIGRQIGFSMALFVLDDYGAVSNLFLPRDRVIGILLGIGVMGAIDYVLWPRRSIDLARSHYASACHKLAGFTARPPELMVMLKLTLPIRLEIEKHLATTQDLLAHATLEPDATAVANRKERALLRAMVSDAGQLSSLLLVRRRYRLLSGPVFSEFPAELQKRSRAFDMELAKALENAALLLRGETVGISTAIAEVHPELKQVYTDHHRIDNLPVKMARNWQLRFLLDQHIMRLVTTIQAKAQHAAAYRNSRANGA